MKVHCPGCRANLNVDDESYRDKVLIQCPECLYVFLAKPGPETGDGAESEPDSEEATLLTSDFAPSSDAREFQWNVPGASITVIEGDNQGIHRKLGGQDLTIGRRGDDLAVADKAVSRRHCRLEKREDGWWIKDLDSTNGTLVNGNKVDQARLHHLDEIRIGATRILFAEAEASKETLPAGQDEEPLDVTRVDDKLKEPELHLPGGREFYLEFMTGAKKGRSIKFEKARIIIGRGEEADLDLDDPGVSRKHAMIEVQSREHVYITDLASQNGAWLNGVRIRTTRLLHGDRLRLGNTVLKFVVQDLSPP